MKEPNMFHNYEIEKITHKASDAAEYIVVWFFRPRSSCTTHLILFSERPQIHASLYMTISGGRSELYIIAGFLHTSLALRVIFVRQKRQPIYATCMMISGGRTEQHVVIGFGELAAVD